VRIIPQDESPVNRANGSQNPSSEAFHFATPNPASLATAMLFPGQLSGLIFSIEMCPEKNREIFGILQSHNKLSARYLHNRQLFAVDTCRAAAPRLLLLDLIGCGFLMA
jgi:hypothetical protein